MNAPNLYVGMDIGGTNIRLASSHSLADGELESKVILPNTADYHHNQARIFETIHGFGDTIQAIGIAMAGGLNEQKTGITSSSYLPQWHGKLITDILAEEFSCPVVMDHDLVCAAQAEATYGNGEGRDFMYIGYGSGIWGTALETRDGQPHVREFQERAAQSYFREWQRNCGGKAIEAEFGKPAAEFLNEEWQIVMGRFSRYLAQFVDELQPASVIFGGGIAVKQAARLEEVFAGLKQHGGSFADTTFEITRLGEDACLRGALALLQKHPSST